MLKDKLTLFANSISWCIIIIFLLLVVTNAAASLRFPGNAQNDEQRVKIQIDVLPPDSKPGPPADIGTEDFTLEFWMKASSTDNPNKSGTSCGATNNWIWGNIIFDRDRYEQGRSYGISVDNGVLRFGVENEKNITHTLCGTVNVLDNKWHHVAVQRRFSDGWIQLYVDGTLDAEFDGPDGDISYPDNGVPNKNGCSGKPCTFSDPYLVMGAEKHDLADDYKGWLTEIRLSKSLRYPGNLPLTIFTTDDNTVALYHFNEGSGNIANDTSGATGGPSNGEIKAGVVWSTDSPFVPNDTPGTVQLTITNANVSESGSRYIFSVARDGGVGNVSIDYEIRDGTAMAGSEYQVTQQAASGTLFWNDGQTNTQMLIIDILDDTSPEIDKTVLLSLSNPAGEVILGSNNSAILTIQDDDGAGTLEFSIAALSVNEDVGNVIITVNRKDGTRGEVTVNYTQTVASTAVLGEDYSTIQPTNNVLSFSEDVTTATITIPVIDDTASESTETIILQLSNSSSGSTLAEGSSMIVTILDNDSINPRATKKGSGSIDLFVLMLLLLTIFNKASVNRRRQYACLLHQNKTHP